MCAYTHAIHSSHLEVRGQWGIPVSPATMWILGISLRLCGRHLYLLSHLFATSVCLFKARSYHNCSDQLVQWVLFNNKISTQTIWVKREKPQITWVSGLLHAKLYTSIRQKVFPPPHLLCWLKSGTWLQIWISNNRFLIYLKKSIHFEKDSPCPDKTVTYTLLTQVCLHINCFGSYSRPCWTG